LSQHGGCVCGDGFVQDGSGLEDPALSSGHRPARPERILGRDFAWDSGNPVPGYRSGREQCCPDPVFSDSGDVDGFQHPASGLAPGM